MTWRETDDLSEILAALDDGQRVQVWRPSGWKNINSEAISRWVVKNGWRVRIEVPDEPPAPSLPPGVVATWKAQAKDCPALVDAGWTVRWLSDGAPLDDYAVHRAFAETPSRWFEVCPPEGER